MIPCYVGRMPTHCPHKKQQLRHNCRSRDRHMQKDGRAVTNNTLPTCFITRCHDGQHIHCACTNSAWNSTQEARHYAHVLSKPNTQAKARPFVDARSKQPCAVHDAHHPETQPLRVRDGGPLAGTSQSGSNALRSRHCNSLSKPIQSPIKT